MLRVASVPVFVTTYRNVTAWSLYTCDTGADTVNDTCPTYVGVCVGVEV